MTPELQNIALMRAGGWVFTPTGWVNPNDVKACAPDYPNDLNACHEMEKTLTTRAQRMAYRGRLFDLADSECESPVFATASQKTKALCIILNLWES